MDLLIGFEKEFYLSRALAPSELQFICDVLNIRNAALVTERGKNQYELVTHPQSYNFEPENSWDDLMQKAINTYKNQLHSLLHAINNFGIEFNDSAKPYKDDYGSALQINFSISEFNESDYLSVIYCILEGAQTLQLQINASSGFARFMPGFMAPTHVCWGGNNNRTTLIRMMSIGCASNNSLKKTRVEYRGANSNADPIVLLNFILKMIRKTCDIKALGESDSWNLRLGNKYPKIWGNAHDVQYNLEPLLLRLASPQNK